MTIQPEHAPTATHPLAALVDEILAELAFLVSDDHAAASPETAAWLRGEIDARTHPHASDSHSRGRMVCWCSAALAVQLAANMLGINSTDPNAIAAAPDALGELLSVFCDQFLTARFGPDLDFELGVPRLAQCVAGPMDSDRRSHDYCELQVSGGVLAVAFLG